VTPLDALLLINELNTTGVHPLAVSPPSGPYYDVTQDGTLTANDALVIINFLNRQAAGLSGGEGEGSAAATPPSPKVSSPVLVIASSSDGPAGAERADAIWGEVRAEPVGAEPAGAEPRVCSEDQAWDRLARDVAATRQEKYDEVLTDSLFAQLGRDFAVPLA
jgi:hypothetical protein